MSNSLFSVPSLRGTLTPATIATPLPNSKGTSTERVAFEILGNNDIAKIAARSLPETQQILPPRTVRLGFLESFFWAPVTFYSTERDEEVTVLVNRSSAYKRLGALGFTQEEVRNALTTGSFDTLLIQHKAKTIASLLNVPESSSEFENIQRAVCYNLSNRILTTRRPCSYSHTEEGSNFYDWNLSSFLPRNTVITTRIPFEDGIRNYITYNDITVDLDSNLQLTPLELVKTFSILRNSSTRHLGIRPLENWDRVINTLLYINSNQNEWISRKVAFTKEINGLTLIFEPERSLITLKIGHRYFDFETAQFAMTRLGSHDLDHRQIANIYDFIENNRAHYRLLIEDSKNERRDATPIDIFLPPAKTGLARAIQFSENGEVYIHFNRKAQGNDRLIGKGGYKVVTCATNLSSDRFFASAAVSHFLTFDPNYELINHFRLKGHPGIVETEAMVLYQSTDKVHKKCKCPQHSLVEYRARILTKLYKKDLFSLIASGDISLEDKKSLVTSLVKAVADLHSSGYIHRDIKPENVFVDIIDGNKVAVIGDLHSIIHTNMDTSRNDDIGTTWYRSPEYARARLEKATDRSLRISPTSETMKRVLNKGQDIWALGCTIAQILCPGVTLPWWDDNRDKTIKNLNDLDSTPEPENKNSVEHLIWAVLNVDPAKRPTAEQLIEKIKNLDWDTIDIVESVE